MLISVWYKKFKKKQACGSSIQYYEWQELSIYQKLQEKSIQWDQYAMTRTVNLMYVLTRTVKKPKYSYVINEASKEKIKLYVDSQTSKTTIWLHKKKFVNYKEGQFRQVCDDKRGQSTMFINMQPVTKPNNMQLPKWAIQSSYNMLCSQELSIY